jgi:hypothetical protein
MCFGGKKDHSAEIARADEQARQARIASGMSNIDSVFGQFNDDFYNGRAKAYTDYATPQVDRQYKSQKDSLVYALARTGLLDSSAGQNKNADLSNEFDQNRINIANKALDTANQARSDVENTRSGLTSVLNATGDSSAAAASALREAQNLNMPQGFSPLGQLFSDFSGTVAQIGSNAKNDYSGFSGGGNLFNAGSGSSRVVR